MIKEDFTVFILTHGRPNNVKTYKTLKRFGYTGKIHIVIDNEDIDNPDYEIITPDLLEPYLSDDVCLVTFQVLQYRSGALNPIKDLTNLAKKYGALTVWDASHAAGSVHLNFNKNDIKKP